MRVWIMFWVLLCSPGLIAAETEAENVTENEVPVAAINLDRSWGLLIGDHITATIDLPVPAGDIEESSLPQRDKRHGAWLFLKDHTLVDGQLIIQYQILNVPAQNREVTTPAFELRTVDGGFITVPPTVLQIGSFLPQQNTEGDEDNRDGRDFSPRGDKVLLADDAAGLKQQLFAALIVLLLAVMIWLAWHFGLRPRHRLPFAHALFELNKMRWLGKKDADAASRSLHKAFNRSANRVIVASQLEKLWQQCPWLLPLQSEISSFYQQSAQYYFTAKGGETKDFQQVVKLAKACRAREKMA